MLDFLLKGLNRIYFCTSIVSLKYKPSFPKDEVNQVKTPERKQSTYGGTGAPVDENTTICSPERSLNTDSDIHEGQKRRPREEGGDSGRPGGCAFAARGRAG